MQNDLFKSYKNAGQTDKALIAADIMLHREPGNRETFDLFWSYLCELETKAENIEDKRFYARQARSALELYYRNAELTEKVIDEIEKYHRQMGDIYGEIEKMQQELETAEHKAVKAFNQEKLDRLGELKEQMEKSNNDKEYDSLLAESGRIDSEISKDFLDDEQLAAYSRLTNKYAAVAGEKMHRKNAAYNNKAIQDYYGVYCKFKGDEAKYKSNFRCLHSLVKDTLFGYDPSRLFNETMIYYNHVYTYIFNKLDDYTKMKFTQFSCGCHPYDGVYGIAGGVYYERKFK